MAHNPMVVDGTTEQTAQQHSAGSVVRVGTLVLLVFGALSALLGMMLAFFAGAIGVPFSLLEGSVFSSYLVPGVVLGVVVGGTQAAAAVTLMQRRASALPWVAVAGFGMMIWIFVEIAIIREYSVLQTIYFALGVLELVGALLLLGITPRLVGRAEWAEPQPPDSPR